MERSRNFRQVAQILLDNSVIFGNGLCSMLTDLEGLNFITKKEVKMFNRHIKRITKKDIHGYIWTYGFWKPRKEFLEAIVEKREKDYERWFLVI